MKSFTRSEWKKKKKNEVLIKIDMEKSVQSCGMGFWHELEVVDQCMYLVISIHGLFGLRKLIESHPLST